MKFSRKIAVTVLALSSAVAGGLATQSASATASSGSVGINGAIVHGWTQNGWQDIYLQSGTYTGCQILVANALIAYSYHYQPTNTHYVATVKVPCRSGATSTSAPK